MLQEIRECRERLSSFRKQRRRCLDYTFGRQWNDLIEVDGRRITEYEYILREGNVPLKNNLIRRIVRNVLGVFREKLPDLMKREYGEELHEIIEKNSMEELFCRTMEEFLISGMAIHRKRLCCREGVPGVWTEMVSPSSVFFNTDTRDVRGWDINLIGQVHSVDMLDWCRAFVKTPNDYAKATRLFDHGRRRINVTEVWKREVTPRYLVHDREAGLLRRIPAGREDKERCKDMPKKWITEEVWRYYFITDDGSVICEGDSPYIHGGHPYVMKCYPMIDGEIHSFVGDMIDQQRYTNRLITLYDWVIRASAKGVLLLPEGSVSPANIRTVADQWSRFNGVIVYKSDPNRPEPKQISGKMSDLGISELLEIQLKMLEDVSGVNGILQGNTGGGNVSGELYNAQTANAMYSLQDLLETFGRFVSDCGAKDKVLFEQSRGLNVKEK